MLINFAHAALILGVLLCLGFIGWTLMEVATHAPYLFLE